MNRRFAILAACALLALAVPASADASLIIVLASRSRIVAASDSRGWHVAPDGTRRDPVDSVRKIEIRGRFLFASTGTIGPGTLDAFAAWQSMWPVVGETITDCMDRIVAGLRNQKVVPPVKPITIGLYRFAEETVDARVVRIRKDGTGLKVEEHSDIDGVPYVQLLGWNEVETDPRVKTLVDQMVVRLVSDPSEAEMVTLARAALMEVESWTSLVGGPPHLAVLDAAGARWITQER